MPDEEKVIIFNIQKYSLHDGSGIRTVVFLKGCPLRCRWCCNPESQRLTPEVMYRRERCLGQEKCGLCASAAPEGGISFDREGKAVVNFPLCNVKPEWARACPAGALTVSGRQMSIGEILNIVERDAAFYRHGGGGMTLSGGEPLMQENAVGLLRAAKSRYIHTAVETCGHVETARLLEAAAYLDEIFFDIKSLDNEKHLTHTGVTGELIRKNLRALCEVWPEKKKTVRTPVIPGFNDSPEELRRIENFVRGLPDKAITWRKLPYHAYGAGKYAMLGRAYKL